MPNNSSEATLTAAEILLTAAARSLPTSTAADILPTATEATIAATPSHPRIRKRPAWMEDYKVTGIEDPITHFAFQSLIFLYFHIVILQLLKVLSKKKNGGRRWMMKLMPLKEIILGS